MNLLPQKLANILSETSNLQTLLPQSMNGRKGKEAKTLGEKSSNAKNGNVTFKVPGSEGRVNAKDFKEKSSAIPANEGSFTVKPQADKGPRRAGNRKAPVPDTPGIFSLTGLLAAQRLTRELKNRVSFRNRPSLRTSRHSTVTVINDQVPVNSAKPKVKFSCSKAEKLIKGYLPAKLAHVSYDPVGCAGLTTALCEEIKSMIKKVTPARYRLICNVTIGSNSNDNIAVTSQCLWDPYSDNFMSCSYTNPTLFCVVLVYAVYLE
uniref:Tctex1 domain-containing protein 1-like n=1 Tax=Geotrypetes seraphini TaxID=260995 RepID=A0A6P8PE53_GEOSA|nr:tctex1 domain-containing protein 1-like [Geotrypetes seraphini]